VNPPPHKIIIHYINKERLPFQEIIAHTPYKKSWNTFIDRKSEENQKKIKKWIRLSFGFICYRFSREFRPLFLEYKERILAFCDIE